MTRRDFIFAGIGISTVSSEASPKRAILGARDARAENRKRLPYDSEVEYLEGFGSQYIDTGVYGNLYTKIEVGFSATMNSHFALSGDFTTTTAAITMPANNGNSGLYSRFGDKVITTGLGQPNGYHDVMVDRTGYYSDGSKRGTFGTTKYFQTSKTIGLFQFTSLGRNYLIGNVYYCKIYDNGELVRDMIPVRFTNEYGVSEGAMYDTVSGKMFRNVGIGEFSFGPDI